MPTRTSLPGAPNPTPRSAFKPPIYNPYDKFTKAEFDAWIGDITGALRRALGEEGPVAEASKREISLPESTYDDDDDDVAEDSFAEIKARRAAKGKQRATEADEDEDEDELDDYEVEASIIANVSDSDHEEDTGARRHNGWGYAEDNSQWSQGDDEGSEEMESDSQRPAGNADEPIEISDSEDEETTPSRAAHKHPQDSHEDDYEDEEVNEEEEYDDEEGDEGDEFGVSLMHTMGDEEVDIVDDEDEQEELEEEADHEVLEVDEDEGSDEFPLPSQGQSPPPVDIPDPWEGPSTYAEDFYAGGDVPPNASNPHMLPTEEGDENDEEEFPPHGEDELRPVELADKWSGPRIYAEDFYAGGDMPSEVAATQSPSHLTPNIGTPRYQEDDDEVGMVITPGVLSAAASPSGVSEEIVDPSTESPGAGETPTFSMPSESESVIRGSQSGTVDNTTSVDNLLASIGYVPPQSAFEIPSAHQKSPHLQTSPQEVVEISDDEEDDEPVGPAPLGTSDLDIPINASYDRDEDDAVSLDDNREDLVTEEENNIFNDDVLSAAPFAAIVDAQDDIYYDDIDALYEDGLEYQQLGTTAAEFPEMATLEGENFEPVLPAGTEFDGIPTPALHLKAAADEPMDEEKFLEALAHIQDISTEAAKDGVTTSIDDISIVQEVTTLEDTVADQDGRPRTEDVQVAVVEETYTVEEFSDNDGVEISALDDGLEVTTDRGETPVVPSDFVVEEAVTEGRRTEEPDAAILDEEPESNSAAPSIGEAAGMEAETEASAAISAEAHRTESDPSEPPTRDDADSLPTITVLEDELAPESSSEGQRQYSPSLRMLSPGVPMPVSADPNVPDPASVHDTPEGSPAPRSPSPSHVEDPDASQSTESSPSKKGVLSAVPPALAQLFTQRHSPSGLFTPLSGASSSAASPEAGTSAEGSVVGVDEPSAPPDGSPSPSTAEAYRAADHTETLDTTVPDAMEDADQPPSRAATDLREESEITSAVEPAGKPLEEHDADVDAEGDDDSEYAGSVSGTIPVESTEHPPAMEQVAASQFGPVDTGSAEVQSQPQEGDTTPVQVESNAPEPSKPFAEGTIRAGSPPPAVSEETTSMQPAEESEKVEVSKATEEVVIAEELAPKRLEDNVTEDPTENSGPHEPEEEGRETNDGPETVSPSHGKNVTEASEDISAASNESSAPARNLKRKRTSPPPSSRMTRSRSTNAALPQIEVPPPQSPSAKKKGKRPARVAELIAEDEGESEEDQLHDLEPEPSKAGSRASSVLSVASSLSFPPSSPTAPTHDAAPRPLFHDNGTLIHRHGLHHHAQAPPRALDRVKTAPPVISSVAPDPPPQPQVHSQTEPQAEPQPQSQTPPEAPPEAGTSTANEQVEQEGAEESPELAVLPAPTVPKPSATTNSPVTRSNCRFHKISIPRENNSSRVFFAVPGCSLSNRELMKKQNIEDHGLVTREDSEGLIADVEFLQISPYVVGFLRQLVGVDLLREQEVYYIRQGDEKVRRKRTKQFKPRLSTIETISGRNGIPLSTSPRNAKAVNKPVSSVSSLASSATSASTARSKASTRYASSVASGPSISDNEGSDTEKKPAKRRRRAKAAAPSVEDGPDAQASTSKIPTEKRPVRRSRRLASDAAAYKPGDESEEPESEQEQEAGRKKGRRKRTVRKRARDGDDTAEQPSEGKAPAKKRKTAAASAPPTTPAIAELPQEEAEAEGQPEVPSTNGDANDS